MIVTLDVSKFSGWLNADACCRAEGRHAMWGDVWAGRREGVGRRRRKRHARRGGDVDVDVKNTVTLVSELLVHAVHARVRHSTIHKRGKLAADFLSCRSREKIARQKIHGSRPRLPRRGRHRLPNTAYRRPPHTRGCFLFSPSIAVASGLVYFPSIAVAVAVLCCAGAVLSCALLSCAELSLG